MPFIAIVALMFAAQASAGLSPCDLVPERDLPNCRFTTRSTYALHGPVHTVPVQTQTLAPDPGTRDPKLQASPRLFVQQPGVWLVFSPEGDLIENAGSLAANRTPLNPSSERKFQEGLMTVVIGGTPGDPESYRRETRVAHDGELEQTLFYEHGRVVSHTIERRDSSHRSVEQFTYDGNGKLIAHSIERRDDCGRMLEWIVFNGGRLTLHVRDTYDDSTDGDEASSLISREWLDEQGLPFRQISLRNGTATSAWQRPNWGKLCEQSSSVGLNFWFEYATSYEFQPNGTVLNRVEHHQGRYGNIDNDDLELLDQDERLLEKIAYRYVRDNAGSWTERTTSILDPTTGRMVEVRLDKKELTYY